jgi:hypothetical protein
LAQCAQLRGLAQHCAHQANQVFAEIEQTRAMQLRGTEQEVILKTLQLFAFGMYVDYKGALHDVHAH